MNTSQKDPNKPVMDEVDDLTRFLDEDFATDDVDLFEFTGEEESPLTQLKSIILSLDWEITDETLQDLIDEIDHLKHQELFENDKVSQVYLQGLDKITHYLQSEGAHSHPNSIKLLLTLYYDFEKILSSEHITGAEITALLKADVRKFKILQHQIAQKHGVTAATEEVATPLPLTEHEDLQGVQAAILELDWEVTDEGLKNLSDQLTRLKTRYEDNSSIKIIIQGLYSLNSYLSEEKSRAHPETFSLIHHFFDALEMLIEDEGLDEEKKKEILVDRVNRLNNLKNLIAQTYSTEDLAPEAISPVAEAEEELELDSELTGEGEETPAEMPAAEEESPAEQAAPAQEEMLIPTGSGEEDDEYDEPLVADGEELPPALSDSGEEAGFGSSGDLEAPPDELEEKLNFFFGETKEEFEPEAIEEAAAQKATEEIPETPPEEEDIAPALAGSPEEEGFSTEAEAEAPPEELTDKLDSFFGPSGEAETTEVPAPEAETPVEEEPSLALEAEEEGEEEEVASALSDFDEEAGFGAEGTEIEAPPEELEEKLAFFFGGDEEKTPAEEPAGAEETPAAVSEEQLEETEPSIAFEAEEEGESAVAFEAEEEGEEEIASALSDFDEEVGFSGEGTEVEAPSAELTDKLDSFFGETEEKPSEKEPATEAEPEEEEVLLTPALEEPAEEEAPVFEEPEIPAVTSAEEYQAAVEQMRSSFRELQSSMRSEIESLRRELESLRSELKK